MAIIQSSDLPAIRERHKNQRVIFCSGAFDLTHAGHVLFFEDCKKHGDVLVVALGSDALAVKIKGPSRPILNEELRLKMVSSLKPVDYCFVDRTPLDQPPLTLLDAVFATLRPDVYVINEDAFDIPYRKAVTSQFGVELLVLPRWYPPEFDGISTTKIIEKIKHPHRKRCGIEVMLCCEGARAPRPSRRARFQCAPSSSPQAARYSALSAIKAPALSGAERTSGEKSIDPDGRGVLSSSVSTDWPTQSEISYGDLPAIRERHKGQKIVFCSGSFDLTHAAHVLFFEAVKRLGDVLVVAVGNDALIAKLKGPERPIFNEHIRRKMVSAFKPVDYCFIGVTSPDEHPLRMLELAFETLRPDTYAVTSESFDIPHRAMLAGRYGVECAVIDPLVAILERPSSTEFTRATTTNIISRIRRLG